MNIHCVLREVPGRKVNLGDMMALGGAGGGGGPSWTRRSGLVSLRRCI